MNKTLLIAEIGQAHDGSLGILHSYIDALSKTGIDAIKFQTHIAEAESSAEEPFRIQFSYEDASRFDYWKRMSFSAEAWEEIKRHCEQVNLEFMSSPFSIAAVELLEQLDVKRYKVGSGEINNYLLLDRIAETCKPVILSSGLATFSQLDEAVERFTKHDNDLTVLQCTTQYPTTAKQVGLNVISELKARYPHCKVGFSDHSARLETCLTARALGAEVLEFHAVFDRNMFGPDANSSLTLKEIRELANGIRYLEDCFDHPVDKNKKIADQELVTMFGKSLAVNKDLPVGATIRLEDLESKKPFGRGIFAKNYQQVVGRKLVVSKRKYEFLGDEDLEA